MHFSHSLSLFLCSCVNSTDRSAGPALQPEISPSPVSPLSLPLVGVGPRVMPGAGGSAAQRQTQDGLQVPRVCAGPGCPCGLLNAGGGFHCLFFFFTSYSASVSEQKKLLRNFTEVSVQRGGGHRGKQQVQGGGPRSIGPPFHKVSEERGSSFS